MNVDDLESAVGRRFELQGPPITISARDGADHLPGVPPAQGLEVIHLNGVVPSPPEGSTFSETQYAERIGNQEPWYSRCVVEITSRPVIFIGTVLSESLLWHHMYLRKRRESLARDLRPTSILVTKELSLPRREILRDLRINWVQGTAEGGQAACDGISSHRDGLYGHPISQDLFRLRDDLKKEVLLTVVGPNPA